MAEEHHYKWLHPRVIQLISSFSEVCKDKIEQYDVFLYSFTEMKIH